MRKLRFPTRRVPTSVPDSEIEDRKEQDHKFENLGALAVILGIAAEFALALLFREHKAFLENWGPAAADALIGLGIVAEVHFAARAGEKSEELRRRALDRLAKSESSLLSVTIKLLLAESKLEPRRLSPQDKNKIRDMTAGVVKTNINFFTEQNEKATVFAWSIMDALKDGGLPVGAIPFKMPPGEKLMCPVLLHCPGGKTSSDDPLYQALVAVGLSVGITSFCTLSLETSRPTPLDIGKAFSPFPNGPRLPNEEYIVWIGEQSTFDDQNEIVRRLQKLVGTNSRGPE